MEKARGAGPAKPTRLINRKTPRNLCSEAHGYKRRCASEKTYGTNHKNMRNHTVRVLTFPDYDSAGRRQLTLQPGAAYTDSPKQSRKGRKQAKTGPPNWFCKKDMQDKEKQSYVTAKTYRQLSATRCTHNSASQLRKTQLRNGQNKSPIVGNPLQT